jgi:hypothetical protein
MSMPSRAYGDESVESCGAYPNEIFHGYSSGMTLKAGCPSGAFSINSAGGSYPRGSGAVWQANAPTGLVIVGARVPSGGLSAFGVNAGSAGQYGGDFYWRGGSSNITPNKTGASFGPFSSGEFGVLMVCGKPTCTPNGPAGVIQVAPIVLSVHETSGPVLSSPRGLWLAKGWVRGTWNLEFWGDSPSGLCGLVANFGDLPLPGTTSTRDPSTWQQCAAGPVVDSVVTEGYAQGPNQLRIGAWDAAGEQVNYTRTVDVDNQQPSVALAGPTDAASTAGTQYVTATASAGPSGVAGISCSVDGGPWRWHGGQSDRVGVSGVGEHQVRCVSENDAVDGAGVHGRSAVQTFEMKIGVPTVSAIAFSKIVNQLRCHPTRRPSRAKRGTGTKCSSGAALHKHQLSIRARHGRAITVHGWLGTYTGAALGGQSVNVLAAPNDGRRLFTSIATVTTAANGSWTARVPAGPSRLIEAAYAGGPNSESSVSGLAREIVPAKIQLLRVTPRRVAWGQTLRIIGRLDGGHLPPGGALIRLRIGLGSAFTTYGVHEHVGGNGRFTTSYTFGLGSPAIHRAYWFQVASLPMGNYPYAPASSRRVSVLVGGHPSAR